MQLDALGAWEDPASPFFLKEDSLQQPPLTVLGNLHYVLPWPLGATWGLHRDQ